MEGKRRHICLVWLHLPAGVLGLSGQFGLLDEGVSSHAKTGLDLVAELRGRQVVGIEVKATGAPTRSAAKHLMWMRDALGERFLAGVVLHTGPRVYQLDNRIIAAPIGTLWT